jgi:hypothetical protein
MNQGGLDVRSFEHTMLFHRSGILPEEAANY